jgi:hypothetical protein
MRRTVTLTIAFVVAAVAGPAAAAEPELGERGRFTLSAERLFGYVHSTTDTTIGGGIQTTESTDSFTLLTNPASGLYTGYGWPRLAFDAFVARGVSVGGALAIAHVAPDEGDSITGFLVAPRVGYALRLGSHFALWPRVGFTYTQVSTNPAGAGADLTVKAYAITLEAPFAIAIGPRMALHLGPAFDIGVGGSTAAGGGSLDSSTTDLGVHAGLLIVL